MLCLTGILGCLLTTGSLSAQEDDAVAARFEQQVRPLLREYCTHCHNEDEQESGIRVDHLDGRLAESTLRLWEEMRDQISDQAMPPEGQPQPTDDERAALIDWIDIGLDLARSRNVERNGAVRRLTVEQYSNTLRDLLGLDQNLTEILPPDGVSKSGFTNDAETLSLSPLLIESYLKIAQRALDLCIVDPRSRPVIQNFRMDLGKSINPSPLGEKLILGPNNLLLDNEDFVVEELVPNKPFEFEPFFMRKQYRFNEGYAGNSTVRGWRDYNSIYHAVFACMRGQTGYPKGLAYQTVPNGLLLRPAKPTSEIFGESSTYGNHANFKIAVRELPAMGRYRVTVRAAKYDDGLLLDPGAESLADLGSENHPISVEFAAAQRVEIEQPGVYQIDIEPGPEGSPEQISLALGDRYFDGAWLQPAFLVVRLAAGPVDVTASHRGGHLPSRVVFTPLEESSDLIAKFHRFERRQPRVGLHIGVRRDCGHTLIQAGEPQTVRGLEAADYVFEGAIENFPMTTSEAANDNYIAGVRELAVRSEYTDGRDMPRLMIQSVEFEGPYVASWPPESHRRIFFDSESQNAPNRYAEQVIRRFSRRAFRRPIDDDELASLMKVQRDAFAVDQDFRRSIQETLLVVLTSPSFLFLIENSSGPEPEDLDPWELASKLSYFLWNGPPDDTLDRLADADKLSHSLTTQVERMIADRRFKNFTTEFASQWLSLDKLEVVDFDRKKFPGLTRLRKQGLRDEPGEFLRHLIRNDLPVVNLIDSDIVMANEVVANYYGLADQTEQGFDFVPIRHGNEHLGGVLSQAAVLAGLSNGRDANPVKRGAFVARRIVDQPPADPPPNVPDLQDNTDLPLREQLERHRNVAGCIKCHEGIDPWGIALHQYGADGLFADGQIDARSTLPDGTEVTNHIDLKSHLVKNRLDLVAFSFMKHLATYAIGRNLTYNEIRVLREKCLELQPNEYRTKAMIHAIVQSELFLKK